MTDQQTVTATRGRFWRRTFAFTIDSLVVSGILGLLGVILFAPTNGRIRSSQVVIKIQRCQQIDPASVRLQLPEGFRANQAIFCTMSVLGHVHDRTVSVAEVTRSGSTTYRRMITLPADADGQPTSAFYLDYLILPLLFIYLLLMEWRFGETIGKGLLGLRVRSLAGNLMTLSQSAKRQIVRFMGVYPVLAAAPAILTTPYSQLFGLLNYFLAFAAVGALLIAIQTVNFVRAVRRNELPWHDRWARTEVIHLV